MSEDVDSKKNFKGLRIAGWCCLASAVILPFAITNGDNAFATGEFVGTFLMVMALVVIVTSLVFRRSSKETQERVTLATGIIMLGWSVLHTSSAKVEENHLKNAAKNYVSTVEKIKSSAPSITSPESASTPVVEKSSMTVLSPTTTTKESIANFLDQMAKVQKGQAEEVIALNAKFEQIDLSTTLVPQNLIRADGIAQSKTKMKQFEQLVHMRDKLYNDIASKNKKILLATGLSQTDKDEALEVFTKNWGRQAQILTSISSAQLNMIDATTKILDMCENGLGSFSVRDNNIMFQTQPQLDLYRSQMARLQKYAIEEGQATTAFTKLTEEVQGSTQRDLQKLIN